MWSRSAEVPDLCRCNSRVLLCLFPTAGLNARFVCKESLLNLILQGFKSLPTITHHKHCRHREVNVLRAWKEVYNRSCKKCDYQLRRCESSHHVCSCFSSWFIFNFFSPNPLPQVSSMWWWRLLTSYRLAHRELLRPAHRPSQREYLTPSIS